MKYIKKFEDLGMKDIATVGGKNASLGEMINQLGFQGILIPTGFAITDAAYWYVVNSNNLLDKLKLIMAQFTDKHDLVQLSKVGEQARMLIEHAKMPDDLAQEIVKAYGELSKHYNVREADVAVRSSATSEDSPEASFAGQQDSFLNVHGDQELLKACLDCMASLFTDRAIMYRIDKGFDHFKIAISVGVQKMVRSDKACSGVAFSLDTETGFRDVVVINASYGLGESIVQGLVIPDEFYVFKTTLAKGFKPIVKKQLGTKNTQRIYGDKDVVQVPVPEDKQHQFSLNDEEIVQLSKWVMLIEQHYSSLRGKWQPMDIEWAKDGLDNKLYIIQARPETIHGKDNHVQNMVIYKLLKVTDQELQKLIILTGQSIGQKIAHGKVRIIQSAKDMDQLQLGEILVTRMTDPDWVPIMKKSAGIITTSGGRTCHAAIVSRELGIPALVGAQQALELLTTGQDITIDCSRGKTGYVYRGSLDFDIENIVLSSLEKPAVPLMVNIGAPEVAYTASFLPVSGVGLARLEFIISDTIQIHPMAIIHPEKVTDYAIIKKIKDITLAYPTPKDFYISSLAQGIGTIACAFYPRPVFVRLPDFKSNEYRNLIGGSFFETQEANPMMGFRGAFRYYHDQFKEAFALDCQAILKVINEMGLNNIKLLVPFVRTVAEGQKVIAELAKNGIDHKLMHIFMMCETPDDVLMIDEFSQHFDGFSIGSNDLTQFTLSVDRDSEIMAPLFNERSEAVKKMMKMAVCGAHRNNKYIGICGQAPSDYPEIAEFLICLGIDSISLNTDAVIPFLMKKIRCSDGERCEHRNSDITVV